MRITVICILSLIVASNLLYGSDSMKFSKTLMTPQRFFDELFNEDAFKKLSDGSTKKYPELSVKAQQGDIDAIFKLAERTDSGEVPPMVPMYWYSKAFQLLDKIDNPTERDAINKKRATLGVRAIDTEFRLVYISGLIKMNQHELGHLTDMPLLAEPLKDFEAILEGDTE